MQLRIHFDADLHYPLYESYCRFLFKRIKKSIKKLINPKKYKVREPFILESSIIKWDGKPLKSLNLIYYVVNCLEMRKVKGEYVIKLNESWKIPKSSTKVSTLIKLLEYGNEKIPPYPVVTRVLAYYKKVYPNLIVEFMKEELFR